MNTIEAIRNKLFKILAMVMPLKLSFCLLAHLTTLESAEPTLFTASGYYEVSGTEAAEAAVYPAPPDSSYCAA
jgi:hypothetical protein